MFPNPPPPQFIAAIWHMIGSDAHVTGIESKVQWFYHKALVETLNVGLLAKHFAQCSKAGRSETLIKFKEFSDLLNKIWELPFSIQWAAFAGHAAREERTPSCVVWIRSLAYCCPLALVDISILGSAGHGLWRSAGSRPLLVAIAKRELVLIGHPLFVVFVVH